MSPVLNELIMLFNILKPLFSIVGDVLPLVLAGIKVFIVLKAPVGIAIRGEGIQVSQEIGKFKGWKFY